jgi:hypothetical protein
MRPKKHRTAPVASTFCYGVPFLARVDSGNAVHRSAVTAEKSKTRRIAGNTAGNENPEISLSASSG